MTTTAPRIKAGGLPPTHLHRVDASLLNDDRAVMVAGDAEPRKYADRPMPYEFAGDEPEDGGPEMLAAVIVLTLVCLALGSFIAGVLL